MYDWYKVTPTGYVYGGTVYHPIDIPTNQPYEVKRYGASEPMSHQEVTDFVIDVYEARLYNTDILGGFRVVQRCKWTTNPE